jgi:hypothetical protein
MGERVKRENTPESPEYRPRRSCVCQRHRIATFTPIHASFLNKWRITAISVTEMLKKATQNDTFTPLSLFPYQ